MARTAPDRPSFRPTPVMRRPARHAAPAPAPAGEDAETGRPADPTREADADAGTQRRPTRPEAVEPAWRGQWRLLKYL